MTAPSRTYCCLYDRVYLPRGLLVIESLLRLSSAPAEVYVLCLDRESAHKTICWREAHERENQVHTIDLATLAGSAPEVLRLMGTRPHREWCWTLASVFSRHVLGHYVEPGGSLAYVDADIWWFADPEVCWREMGGASIGIHEHRFPVDGPAGSGYHPPPVAERIASSGRFNVGFVAFRKDATAAACLDRWARQCIDRCDASTCGDQRYLDEWPERYTGSVHVFCSPGIGVATWNVWGYEVRAGASWPNVPTVDGAPVAFHHFHEHVRIPGGSPPFVRSRGYPLRPVDVSIFYEPYESAYLAMEREIEDLR